MEVESEDDQDGDVKNLHCPMIDYQSEWRNYRLSGSAVANEVGQEKDSNHCTIPLVKLFSNPLKISLQGAYVLTITNTLRVSLSIGSTAAKTLPSLHTRLPSGIVKKATKGILASNNINLQSWAPGMPLLCILWTVRNRCSHHLTARNARRNFFRSLLTLLWSWRLAVSAHDVHRDD